MSLLINKLGVFFASGYGRYAHLPIIRNLIRGRQTPGPPHDFGNYRELTVPTVTEDLSNRFNPFRISCLPWLRSDCDFQDSRSGVRLLAAAASEKRPVRRHEAINCDQPDR